MNTYRLQVRFLPGLFVLLVIFSIPVQSVSAASIRAVTKPQRDVFLSFTVGGKIDQITCKEGDKVIKDALIASLEMTSEELRLRQLRLQAEDMSALEIAELELKQKEYDLSRIVAAHYEGAAADSEQDNARLEVDVAKLKLKKAKNEHELLNLRYQELKAELLRRKIISPFSGVISTMDIDPGEAVDALRPVVRIVDQEKLWVDVMVPLRMLGVIKDLQRIPVHFPDYNNTQKADLAYGQIDHISALADSASETVKIRIDLKNPGLWPIGTPVDVEVPDLSGNKETEPATMSSIKDPVSGNNSTDGVNDRLFKPILSTE